jgi:hypothetical protein
MAGTELKTDSFQRWVMYSKDAYGNGRIFLSTEQKQAVEEGKKFSQRAYADVWAKDAALVGRVRSFLGTNFFWHERLAKNGADVEVIETLQSMIRGESVVLIGEQSRTGAGGNPPPKPQGLPSFRSSLMNDCGMSYAAATAYIERYNASVDRINAARAARAAVSSGAGYLVCEVEPVAGAIDNGDDTAGVVGPDDTGLDGSTPLGDAQPFDYQPDVQDGDVEELAAGDGRPGNNQAQNKQFKAVVKALGLNQDQARQLHDDIQDDDEMNYHGLMDHARDLFGG